MRASLAALVLAATAVAATPGSSRHKMFHRQSKRAPADAEISARAVQLATALSSLGIPAIGTNEGVSEGAAGPYTNTIINNYGEDLPLVAWNNGQFALSDASPPVFTTLIPDGQSVTISMSATFSGAMTVVPSGTKLASSGMVNNTLIELTTGDFGVVDISREVTMLGTNISVSGQNCETSFDKCAFQCINGAITCGWDAPYELFNCATGSQVGASYGTYAGAPSGGCMIEKAITTTINPKQ